LATNSMNDEERANYLMKALKLCFKKSRNPDWPTPRYVSAWGSKTEAGLRQTIKRAMVSSGEELPKLGDRL
jgi:hypothetical protein